MSCVETFAIYHLRNWLIYDAKCTSPTHSAQSIWFVKIINIRPRRTYTLCCWPSKSPSSDAWFSSAVKRILNKTVPSNVPNHSKHPKAKGGLYARKENTTVNSTGHYDRKDVLTNISYLFWKSKTMAGKERKLWEGCDTLPDSHTHFHIGRYMFIQIHMDTDRGIPQQNSCVCSSYRTVWSRVFYCSSAQDSNRITESLERTSNGSLVFFHRLVNFVTMLPLNKMKGYCKPEKRSHTRPPSISELNTCTSVIITVLSVPSPTISNN